MKNWRYGELSKRLGEESLKSDTRPGLDDVVKKMHAEWKVLEDNSKRKSDKNKVACVWRSIYQIVVR